MLVATYNMFCGLPGDTLLRAWHGQALLHGNALAPFIAALRASTPDAARVRDSASVVDAVELIGTTQPTIVCLNEVLVGLQGPVLRRRLRAHGYRVVTIGPAAHHAPPLRIGTLLAARVAAQSFAVRLPWGPWAGGGGGACGMYLPSLHLSVIAAHLAPVDALRRQQVEALCAAIAAERAKGRQVVVVGDLNMTPSAVRASPLSRYVLPVVVPHGTFPSWPLWRLAARQLDHVLLPPTFLPSGPPRRVLGTSDHLMLVADIRVRPRHRTST